MIHVEHVSTLRSARIRQHLYIHVLISEITIFLTNRGGSVHMLKKRDTHRNAALPPLCKHFLLNTCSQSQLLGTLSYLEHQ